MRRLNLALSPATLLLAAVAHGETTISTTTSSNLRTSTAASGAPDAITVGSGGTVSPGSGTAVTIDSSNAVSNAGTISINNADNSVGVAALGGVTTTITNSGTIRVDDAYANSDTNGDGVNDGPFAQGTGRIGIGLIGGGTVSGTITNSATIAVEGNNSFGIDTTGAALAGNIVNTGTISTLGDNDTTVRLGAVAGNVTLNGTVTPQGQNSIGVALTADLTGAFVSHGTITSTGYSVTTAPSDISKLGADNLLQGGPALSIAGNVAGGVLLGASLTSTTDMSVDADGDGVGDSTEGAAAVTSYGAAPGIQIGSATRAISIGPVASNAAASFINAGTITGSAVYSGVNATGLAVGTLGQTVTLTNGILNSGTISANSLDAVATAVLIGAGTIAPSIVNTGTIAATAQSTTSGSAYGMVIAAGASLPTITNSGTITANAPASGAAATAILDQSGGLSSVTNTGKIVATSTGGTARAIDASINTTGFTYTQALASSTATAPSLTGQIVTGSGSDTIAASAGTITSTADLGEGNNLVALSGTAAFTGNITMGSGSDQMTLADTAAYSGTIDFGGGANSLTVGTGATFSGQLLSTGGTVALTVANGGTANFTSAGTTNLASLFLGGTLGVTVDPASGGSSLVQVAGATTIAAGASLKVTVSSLSLTPSSFTVLQSGTLAGSGNLTLAVANLPYLLTGSFGASDASGTISVTVAPKTAAAIGLRRNEAGAYNAVLADIAGNGQLTSQFLGYTDQDSFTRHYRQMLPLYAGGIFDTVSKGVRTLAPSADAIPFGKVGDVGLWVQQAGWSGSQHAGDTGGYHDMGWGLVGGADLGLGGLGRGGLFVGYLYGDEKNLVGGEASANVFEGGIHWIAHWGGLRLSASAAGGLVRLDSVRSIDSSTVTASSLFASKGNWGGTLITANGTASYEAHLGHFYARPAATVSYVRLTENAHQEDGGGSAYDLIIDKRVGRETSVDGTLALGFQFGKDSDADAIVGRVELEGGRRQMIGSNGAGDLVAQFAGGQSFTLSPEARDSGYTGAIRATIGSELFSFTGSIGAETREGYHVAVGRIGLRALF